MGVIKNRGAVAAIALLIFLAWFINFAINKAQDLAGADNIRFGIRQLFESFQGLSSSAGHAAHPLVAPVVHLLS
jgi:hypothetical protein